jgi:hypothetical protein
MKNIVNDLNEMVIYGLYRNPIPIVKGNSIRIGNIVIRQSKNHGYIVIDTFYNKQLCSVYSKKSAIAVAKKALMNFDYNDVLILDKLYEKHKNDCIFYNHTISKTTKENKKYINEARLQVSLNELDSITRRLEKIIFDSK